MGEDSTFLLHAHCGDIELCEDLGPGCERGGKGEGEFRAEQQHAVNAVANPHAVALRLDMNVAGALRQRVADQRIKDLDRAVLLSEMGLPVALDHERGSQDALSLRRRHRPLGLCVEPLLPQQRLNGAVDPRLAADRQFEVRPERVLERVHHEQVGGVGDEDRDHPVGLHEGDHGIELDEALRKTSEELHVHKRQSRNHVGDVQLTAQGLSQLLVGEHPFLDEDFAEGLTADLLLRERLFQLFA